MSANVVKKPKCYAVSLEDGNATWTLTANQPMPYVQIVNRSTSGETLTVKLNGDDEAVFDVYQGEVQTFNPNDVHITKLEVYFEHWASGYTSGDFTVIVSYTGNAPIES